MKKENKSWNKLCGLMICFFRDKYFHFLKFKKLRQVTYNISICADLLVIGRTILQHANKMPVVAIPVSPSYRQVAFVRNAAGANQPRRDHVAPHGCQ